MTDVQTRLLTEADAAAYWQLRLEGLEREPLSFATTPEEHRKTTLEEAAQRLRANPDEEFIMGIFRAGELVGMAGFFRYPGAKVRHKGRIWGVYVRANCRGEGVGRALMVALLERIRACPGIEQVTLTVVKGLVAARSLYGSLGFVPYGLEPHALKVGDRYLDDDHMVLQL
jgi:ribosomal protein S18 acetylase RimI-like enzyme